MTVTIENEGGTLLIKGLGDKNLRTLKKHLTLPNPKYYQLQRMGNTKALYAIQKEFIYYQEQKQTRDIRIGRGNRHKLKSYFERAGVHYLEEDKSTDQPPGRAYRNTVVLRDYQYGFKETIEEETFQEEGIIRCDTGWGKTIAATELIRRRGQRTLIIVPKIFLLKQFRATIFDCMGIDPGILGAGRVETHGDITIATIQTLRRRPEIVERCAELYGLVICDECHLFVPPKTRRVVEALRPKYLYGLTATARRTDEQGKALEFVFGEVLYDGKLPKLTPQIALCCFQGYLPMGEYAEIIDFQINNQERNELIVSTIQKEVRTGRKVICLTKRVRHRDLLKKKLERAGVVARGITAKNAKTEIENLRDEKGYFECLVGTYSLLSHGFDCPLLDTLVFAGDLKSDVLQEQSVGRILRLFKDKQTPKIIDVVDIGNPILRRQAKARAQFYKQQGWSGGQGILVGKS